MWEKVKSAEMADGEAVLCAEIHVLVKAKEAGVKSPVTFLTTDPQFDRESHGMKKFGCNGAQAPWSAIPCADELVFLSFMDNWNEQMTHEDDFSSSTLKM